MPNGGRILLSKCGRKADTFGMAVTPSQFDLLAKLVDVSELRHKVLAQNVANVNTPGYRRLNVTFDEALAQHVSIHGEMHLDQLQPQVVEDVEAPVRYDGNSVDIDGEMMRLNKNTLLNNAYIQVLASKIGMMRRAIDGR